jgi:low affinity Fe/Cu permease
LHNTFARALSQDTVIMARNSRKPDKQDLFTRFTSSASSMLGRPWVFVLAVLVLVVWALSGPVFGFGDTWQLVINTGTTIVTFLMVFIIQNTQNRDNLAINIKRDAVMKKLQIEDKDLLGAEDKSDKDLEQDKTEEQQPD